MKNTTLAALTAILCVGASAAAIAQTTPQFREYQDLGNVTIGTVTVDGTRGPGPTKPPGGPGPGGMDRDTQPFVLGGPVESIHLRAMGSNIDCRSINARFGNGRTKQIFDGRLNQGRNVNVDLPGDNRNLNGLTFLCTSLDRRDATIQISADVGRYRNEWMRGPNWMNTWARIFNVGNNEGNNTNNSANNWQMVGRESFEGSRDIEMTSQGLRGRRVVSIALMPVNADASCSAVTARFANGRSQRLNIRNGDMLRRGVYVAPWRIS
jgi:hypothetical protein